MKLVWEREKNTSTRRYFHWLYDDDGTGHSLAETSDEGDTDPPKYRLTTTVDFTYVPEYRQFSIDEQKRLLEALVRMGTP